MNTPKYTAVITTVNQANSQIGFVTKGDAQERQALVVTVPIGFRWPVEGETWMMRQENGTWYLDGVLPTSDYQTVTPGDAIINSATGVVHVLGSSDGSTDFSFNNNGATNLLPITAPATPASGFVLYVDQADGHLKAKKSTGAVTVLAS